MKSINKIVNDKLVLLLVYVVLFCAYIFPTGLINESGVIAKGIFTVSCLLMYLTNFKKLSKLDWMFISVVVMITIISRRLTFLTFLTFPMLRFFVDKKDVILASLEKTKVLYLCLLATIVYSVLYFGNGNRFAFAAIKEINQSGLAIFCLAVLLYKVNKRVSLFTFALGMLTFSRSYLLSVFLLLISKTRLIKNILKNINVKKWNYFVITVVTSVLFVALGFFYAYEYKKGNIGLYGTFYKFINPLDYSNLFRFTAIIKVIIIFVMNPSKIILGITDTEYRSLGSIAAAKIGIPANPIVPHNLFFSHLKIYGLISVAEVIYISRELKKIVSKNNFMIFIAVALYSVILGAGLYSYWLFLTSILLMNTMDGVANEKK